MCVWPGCYLLIVCCPTSSAVVRPRDATSEETKCAKESSSMLFGAFEIGWLVLDCSLFPFY
jgi:hypothetical protein